jgi:hypothetical protein
MLAAAIGLAGGPRPARAGEPGAALGVDLAGTNYWDQEWTFVDLLKRCRDWGGQLGTQFTVDRDGWINWMAPNWRARAMIGDTDPTFPRNFPLGRYVALYDGEGEVSLECKSCREVSRAPGRVVVDVADTSYVWIIIASINPARYLRNLRVVPIEQEASHATQPFHPKFVEGLRPFAAIRYMQTQKTNGSLQVRWADRTRPGAVFQDTAGGVALEYLIQLANTTATDPWFCIPVRADDDYVRNFARTVWAQLDAGRKVYIEYGNEIWNDGYPYNVDGQWIAAEARRLAIPLSPGDGVGSDMTFRLRYQVYRSRQIFEIFEHEMDALRIDRRRLVRVIASQADYFERVRFTLDYKFPDGTSAYQHADALAIAPYFGGLWSEQEAALGENQWTVSDLLDYIECAVSAPKRLPAICAAHPTNPIGQIVRTDREIARTRGLRLLGYEGGQHLVAWNGHPGFVDKLAAVNRDPRMKAVYGKYLDTWRKSGGELMFLHSYVQAYGKYGYWGMLERQDQPPEQAPKLAAALDFLTRAHRWWTDPWPREAGDPSFAGPRPKPRAHARARERKAVTPLALPAPPPAAGPPPAP